MVLIQLSLHPLRQKGTKLTINVTDETVSLRRKLLCKKSVGFELTEDILERLGP